jgi:DNA-binding response OmpR family regulator
MTGAMQSHLTRALEDRIVTTKILVVDDDQYMRKVVRTMLAAIGVRHIHEASDGISGLEAIRELTPDIVILDWEMPMLDGVQFVRMVRSPGEFPIPDLPIIMLTGHGDRWRVLEAARVGVHEYLLKPVSTKALKDRILSVLSRTRPIVQLDSYYGPAPRRLVIMDEPKPVTEAGKDIVLL